MTERRTLAQRQEALVRALVAGGPVPDGFDPAAISAAAEVCRHKRDAHAVSGKRASTAQSSRKWLL